MLRLVALPVVAAIGVLAAAAPASAAPGPVVPVRVCDEANLRAAIATAPQDATVRFACDGTVTVTPGGGGPIQISSDSLDRRLTIDGGGRAVTLSGGGRSAILRVGGPQVTLRRLTIADGSDMDSEGTVGGAAVIARTPLVVDRVVFRRNRAYNAGGAIATRGPFASLEVVDSVFEDNETTCTISSAGYNGGGGAISVKAGGPTTVRRTVFRRNRAYGLCIGGGAIAAPRTFRPTEAGALTIEASRFEDNNAEIGAALPFQQGGGAVAVFNRAVAVVGSRFTGNRVSALGLGGVVFGGAVHVDQQTDGLLPPLATTVTGSMFAGNGPAPGATGTSLAGGALSLRDAQGVPSVRSVLMTGNRAAQGGALYAATGLALDRSMLVDNTAEVGGAIAVGRGRVTVARSVLLSNTGGACGALTERHDVVLGPGVVERPGTTCATLAATSTPGG